MDTPILDSTQQLSSLTGILVLTVAIIEGLKHILADVPYVRRVPLFVFQILVSVFLITGASLSGTLPGDLGSLVFFAITNILASGGVRTIPRAVMSAPADESGKNPTTMGGSGFFLIVGLMLLLFSSMGCAPSNLDADAARFKAVQHPVATHVEKYPEEKETWDDFMAAWWESLKARGIDPAATRPSVLE